MLCMNELGFTAHRIGQALQSARKATNITQEAFDDISSRTYISAVERGVKVPTLSKIDEFCEVLDLLPLTLLVMAYAGNDKTDQQELLEAVKKQLHRIQVQSY